MPHNPGARHNGLNGPTGAPREFNRLAVVPGPTGESIRDAATDHAITP